MILNKYNQIKNDFLKKICYYVIYIIMVAYATLTIGILLKGFLLSININKEAVQAASINYKGGVQAPPYISNKEAYRKLLIYTKDSYIAESLCDTKYPYMLAAIAKRESSFRPLLSGDSGKSFGLFQIQEKYWGAVPERIPDQVAKAEYIYSTLLQRHKTFYKAIRNWNGSGTDAKEYAKQVYKIQKEIENI